MKRDQSSSVTKEETSASDKVKSEDVTTKKPAEPSSAVSSVSSNETKSHVVSKDNVTTTSNVEKVSLKVSNSLDDTVVKVADKPQSKGRRLSNGFVTSVSESAKKVTLRLSTNYHSFLLAYRKVFSGIPSTFDYFESEHYIGIARHMLDTSHPIAVLEHFDVHLGIEKCHNTLRGYVNDVSWDYAAVKTDPLLINYSIRDYVSSASEKGVMLQSLFTPDIVVPLVYGHGQFAFKDIVFSDGYSGGSVSVRSVDTTKATPALRVTTTSDGRPAKYSEISQTYSLERLNDLIGIRPDMLSKYLASGDFVVDLTIEPYEMMKQENITLFNKENITIARSGNKVETKVVKYKNGIPASTQESLLLLIVMKHSYDIAEDSILITNLLFNLVKDELKRRSLPDNLLLTNVSVTWSAKAKSSNLNANKMFVPFALQHFSKQSFEVNTLNSIKSILMYHSKAEGIRICNPNIMDLSIRFGETQVYKADIARSMNISPMLGDGHHDYELLKMGVLSRLYFGDHFPVLPIPYEMAAVDKIDMYAMSYEYFGRSAVDGNLFIEQLLAPRPFMKHDLTTSRIKSLEFESAPIIMKLFDVLSNNPSNNANSKPSTRIKNGFKPAEEREVLEIVYQGNKENLQLYDGPVNVLPKSNNVLVSSNQLSKQPVKTDSIDHDFIKAERQRKHLLLRQSESAAALIRKEERKAKHEKYLSDLKIQHELIRVEKQKLKAKNIEEKKAALKAKSFTLPKQVENVKIKKSSEEKRSQSNIKQPVVKPSVVKISSPSVPVQSKKEEIVKQEFYKLPKIAPKETVSTKKKDNIKSELSSIPVVKKIAKQATIPTTTKEIIIPLKNIVQLEKIDNKAYNKLKVESALNLPSSSLAIITKIENIDIPANKPENIYYPQPFKSNSSETINMANHFVVDTSRQNDICTHISKGINQHKSTITFGNGNIEDYIRLFLSDDLLELLSYEEKKFLRSYTDDTIKSAINVIDVHHYTNYLLKDATEIFIDGIFDDRLLSYIINFCIAHKNQIFDVFLKGFQSSVSSLMSTIAGIHLHLKSDPIGFMRNLNSMILGMIHIFGQQIDFSAFIPKHVPTAKDKTSLTLTIEDNLNSNYLIPSIPKLHLQNIAYGYGGTIYNLLYENYDDAIDEVLTSKFKAISAVTQGIDADYNNNNERLGVGVPIKERVKGYDGQIELMKRNSMSSKLILEALADYTLLSFDSSLFTLFPVPSYPSDDHLPIVIKMHSLNRLCSGLTKPYYYCQFSLNYYLNGLFLNDEHKISQGFMNPSLYKDDFENVVDVLSVEIFDILCSYFSVYDIIALITNREFVPLEYAVEVRNENIKYLVDEAKSINHLNDNLKLISHKIDSSDKLRSRLVFIFDIKENNYQAKLAYKLSNVVEKLSSEYSVGNEQCELSGIDKILSFRGRGLDYSIKVYDYIIANPMNTATIVFNFLSKTIYSVTNNLISVPNSTLVQLLQQSEGYEVDENRKAELSEAFVELGQLLDKLCSQFNYSIDPNDLFFNLPDNVRGLFSYLYICRRSIIYTNEANISKTESKIFEAEEGEGFANSHLNDDTVKQINPKDKEIFKSTSLNRSEYLTTINVGPKDLSSDRFKDIYLQIIIVTNQSYAKDVLIASLYDWAKRGCLSVSYFNSVTRRDGGFYSEDIRNPMLSEYKLPVEEIIYTSRKGRSVNMIPCTNFLTSYEMVQKFHNIAKKVDLSDFKEYMSTGKELEHFTTEPDWNLKVDLGKIFFKENITSYDDILKSAKDVDVYADNCHEANLNMAKIEYGRSMGFLHDYIGGRQRLENQINGLVSPSVAKLAYLLGDDYKSIPVPTFTDHEALLARAICSMPLNTSAGHEGKTAAQGIMNMTPEKLYRQIDVVDRAGRTKLRLDQGAKVRFAYSRPIEIRILDYMHLFHLYDGMKSQEGCSMHYDLHSLSKKFTSWWKAGHKFISIDFLQFDANRSALDVYLFKVHLGIKTSLGERHLQKEAYCYPLVFGQTGKIIVDSCTKLMSGDYLTSGYGTYGQRAGLHDIRSRVPGIDHMSIGDDAVIVLPSNSTLNVKDLVLLGEEYHSPIAEDKSYNTIHFNRRHGLEDQYPYNNFMTFINSMFRKEEQNVDETFYTLEERFYDVYISYLAFTIRMMGVKEGFKASLRLRAEIYKQVKLDLSKLFVKRNVDVHQIIKYKSYPMLESLDKYITKETYGSTLYDIFAVDPKRVLSRYATNPGADMQKIKYDEVHVDSDYHIIDTNMLLHLRLPNDLSVPYGLRERASDVYLGKIQGPETIGIDVLARLSLPVYGGYTYKIRNSYDIVYSLCDYINYHFPKTYIHDSNYAWLKQVMHTNFDRIRVNI